MQERSKPDADPHSGQDDARWESRRWPAEWEPHRATWLSWPHNIETWPGRLSAVEDAFVEMVRAILPGEGVRIHAQDDAMGDRVRDRLRGAGCEDLADLEIYCVPTDDAWIRDHGGIFVLDQAEEGGSVSRRLLDFEFNAWGGKYPSWALDARVAGEMARRAGVVSTRSPILFEAGSIDGDGAGTLLTTESCLLNPNRAGQAGQRSHASVEAFLADSFGARRVLWLGDGILGDDTDGHVDDLTRFVGPGRVVTAVCGDSSDGNYAALAENRRRLETMTDAEGRRLEVIALPMPDPLFGPDGRLPASYSNFYFANHAVLVPTFGVDQDAEALSILEAAVPDRPIVPIPSQDLILGLGAVHCLTQQEPTAPSS
ncbi:MAG: agmatine deiminase family protein [Myxococcales bacterium]|nr:agmatine deiminase family protein [Myxococcales bacterium]HIK83781.1 agmatine deiminase family protein [Myxococcales bacterium]